MDRGEKHSGRRYRETAEMKRDLEQDVAELLAQKRGVRLVNGLDHLVGLLNEVFADGLVGLFPIPRAAAGTSENLDDLEKIRPGIGRFLSG